MHGEGGGDRGDQVHDQPAVEAHAVGAGGDIGARCLHALARLRQDDIHADLLKDRQGRLMDRLERIV
ncbi:hypothetical protein D3C87_1924060 [compost metagenome]